MKPIVKTCCGKQDTKTGSIIIGCLLLAFSIIFLAVTIGLVAGWEDFDTDFLDGTVDRLNSTSLKAEYVAIRDAFQKEVRPVWKKEFISLYCFLPWYALANILLILGAKLESKLLVAIWLLFSLCFLIWSFVLVSVMFTYDTTPGFVAGVAVAQLCNFAIMTGFIIVVFSFYQELVNKTIQEMLEKRARRGGDEYNIQEET